MDKVESKAIEYHEEMLQTSEGVKFLISKCGLYALCSKSLKSFCGHRVTSVQPIQLEAEEWFQSQLTLDDYSREPVGGQEGAVSQDILRYLGQVANYPYELVYLPEVGLAGEDELAECYVFLLFHLGGTSLEKVIVGSNYLHGIIKAHDYCCARSNDHPYIRVEDLVAWIKDDGIERYQDLLEAFRLGDVAKSWLVGTPFYDKQGGSYRINCAGTKVRSDRKEGVSLLGSTGEAVPRKDGTFEFRINFADWTYKPDSCYAKDEAKLVEQYTSGSELYYVDGFTDESREKNLYLLWKPRTLYEGFVKQVIFAENLHEARKGIY
jgi:hypothetical protein